MYNSRLILYWIGIFYCGAVSSRSCHEALEKKTFSSALYGWLERKGDQFEVKEQDEVRIGAYSLEVDWKLLVNGVELQHFFEPMFPTAIFIRIFKMDSKGIINENELVKNVESFRKGEVEDEACKECELSLIFHAQPKKHHCEMNEVKVKYQDTEWDIIQLDSSRRLNKIMLSKSCEEKKVEEKSITELLVDNLSKLTEKIEKISVNQCDSSKVKSQVVARRNCPSWTAGTSLEVYKRWVNGTITISQMLS